MKIAVVYSDYYPDVTDGLRNGVKRGAEGKSIELEEFAVKGAFEIPLKIKQLSSGGYDGFIALGCVVQGETYHHESINVPVSQALMTLSLDLGLPVAHGVLMTKDKDQAIARSSESRNKGMECLEAVLDFLSN